MRQILPGADFADVDFWRHGKPMNFAPILKASADSFRSANVCLSPEGDTPTSLRVFESLVSGCVPVVTGKPNLIARDLPFPSLIDWDEIAFFVHPLGKIAKSKVAHNTFSSSLKYACSCFILVFSSLPSNPPPIASLSFVVFA